MNNIVLLVMACIGLMGHCSTYLRSVKHRHFTSLVMSNNYGLSLSPSDIPTTNGKQVVTFGSPKLAPPGVIGDDWMLWFHARDDQFSNDVVKLSTGRILLATSKDGLNNWIHHPDSPVLSPSREAGDWFLFDSEHVGVGDVINPGAKAQSKFAVQEGMYIMYIFGGSSKSVSLDGGESKIKGVKMEIGVAVSQDGAHWSRVEGPTAYGAILEPGSPSDFDSLFVGWPTVIEVDSLFRMYYCTFDAKANKYVIGFATASDGLLKWVKRGPIFSGGNFNFDAKGASRRHVIRLDDGTYRMWYEGVSAENVHSIGLARSPDGISWEPALSTPVFSRSEDEGAWDGGGVGSPHVVWLPEVRRWRMYYIGNPQSSSDDGARDTAMGVAESVDEEGTAFVRLDIANS